MTVGHPAEFGSNPTSCSLFMAAFVVATALLLEHDCRSLLAPDLVGPKPIAAAGRADDTSSESGKLSFQKFFRCSGRIVANLFSKR